MVTSNSYGPQIDPKTIRVGAGAATPTTDAAPPAAPTAVPRSAYRSDRVFPIPTTHGDMAIIRQNALTNAVATVADYIATLDASKWPDLSAWKDMVIETAYDFAKFSSGQREVEAISRLTGAGVPASHIAAAVDAHNAETEEG